MSIWEHIQDFWLNALWLRCLVGIIIIIGIISFWDDIKYNIIMPILKIVVSIISIIGGIIAVCIPFGIVVLFWGEDIYNALSVSNIGNIFFWILASLLAIALLTIIILIIKSSFTNQGRLAYMKGVRNNYRRMEDRNANERSYHERCRKEYERRYPGVINAIKTDNWSNVTNINTRNLSWNEIERIKEKCNL